MAETPHSPEMPLVPLQEIQGFLREIVEHTGAHSLEPHRDSLQSYPTAALVVRIPKPAMSDYALTRKCLIEKALIMGLAGKNCISCEETVGTDTIEFRGDFVKAEGGLEHFLANANGLLAAPEAQQRAFVSAFSREIQKLIVDGWSEPMSPLTIISDANLSHDKAATPPTTSKSPRT